MRDGWSRCPSPSFSKTLDSRQLKTVIHEGDFVVPGGGVYGSVYDDRFNLNLISPDASTDTMKITLLADGSLAVPEPGACVLVPGGVAFFIARRNRRYPPGPA